MSVDIWLGVATKEEIQAANSFVGYGESWFHSSKIPVFECGDYNDTINSETNTWAILSTLSGNSLKTAIETLKMLDEYISDNIDFDSLQRLALNEAKCAWFWAE